MSKRAFVSNKSTTCLFKKNSYNSHYYCTDKTTFILYPIRTEEYKDLTRASMCIKYFELRAHSTKSDDTLYCVSLNTTITPNGQDSTWFYAKTIEHKRNLTKKMRQILHKFFVFPTHCVTNSLWTHLTLHYIMICLVQASVRACARLQGGRRLA